MAESNDIVLSLGFDQTKADKAIDRLYSSLSRVEKEMAKILEDQKEYDDQLERAQGMAEMEAQARGEVSKETSAAIDDIINKSSNLSDRYDELTGRATRLKEELREARLDPQAYAEAKEELKQAGKNAGKVKDEINRATPATKKVTSAFSKFSNRVSGLIKRAFIFSVIYKALRKIKEMFDNLLKSNKKIADSFAKIKGNLLTAFQPIWEALQPALEALFAWLVKITAYLAVFVNKILGKNVEESQKTAKAMNEQAKAAKKIKKELAGFDTIQVLDTSEGKEGESGKIEPIFDPELSTLADKNGWVELVGDIIRIFAAGFAGLKIAQLIGLGGFKALGLAAAAIFLTGFIDHIIEGWKGNTSWENAGKGILNGLGLIAGLGLAFGPVGALIGAIIFALGELILLIKLIAENFDVLWWYFKEEVLIPVWEWIKQAGQDIADFFVGIWNWLVTAFNDAINWLVTAFNNTISWIVTAFNNAISWIVTAFNNVVQFFVNAWKWIAQAFNNSISWIVTAFNNSISWVVTAFQNVVGWINNSVVKPIGKFFSDLWNGIAYGAKMAWYGIQVGFLSVVNFLIDAVNALVRGLLIPLNALIEGLNLIPGANIRPISFSIQKIPLPPIPALAQGAVLPPNKPFMAMVGDQKHGTNIETPLETMVAAFRQALAESGGGGKNVTVVLELDKKALGRAVFELYNGENKRTGVNLMGV